MSLLLFCCYCISFLVFPFLVFAVPIISFCVVTDAVIEVEVTDNLNLVAVFEKVVKEAAPTAAPTNAPTATPAPTQAATTTTAPKTGDDTPVMTWFGILLMAALGLGAAGKRKFGNGKEI